jgi:hypothetical protein
MQVEKEEEVTTFGSELLGHLGTRNDANRLNHRQY